MCRSLVARPCIADVQRELSAAVGAAVVGKQSPRLQCAHEQQPLHSQQEPQEAWSFTWPSAPVPR